jgi:hypothetical protein
VKKLIPSLIHFACKVIERRGSFTESKEVKSFTESKEVKSFPLLSLFTKSDDIINFSDDIINFIDERGSFTL